MHLIRPGEQKGQGSGRVIGDFLGRSIRSGFYDEPSCRSSFYGVDVIVLSPPPMRSAIMSVMLMPDSR